MYSHALKCKSMFTNHSTSKIARKEAQTKVQTSYTIQQDLKKEILIDIPTMENLISNKDPDVSFSQHNKYTKSKLGNLKKYLFYVVHKQYHQGKGKQGVETGRPSPFLYCRLCHGVVLEEGLSEHECIKAISGISTIYEKDKSRITIVQEETVNVLYLFIHPVKLDDCKTDVVFCEKCKSFIPKAIVLKTDYNHKCIGVEWSQGKGKRKGGFKSSNLKQLGLRGPKLYLCKLCGQKFKSAEPAERHIRREHGEGEKEVLCSHCGKGFDTFARAKRHEITHHERKDSTESPSKKEFQCPECGKKFSMKAHVQSHREQVHSIGAISQMCDLCGKEFKNEAALKTHMKTHMEKTVACDLCELKFRTLENMRKHRMRHTGERPNVCPYCKHGFIQLGVCKSHILKVHGIAVPKGMNMKTFCDSLAANPDQYGQPRK